MTIIEALKAGKIDRITVGNRWLYWLSYGIEKNHWVVRESRRGRGSSFVLITTENEEEAISYLLPKE